MGGAHVGGAEAGDQRVGPTLLLVDDDDRFRSVARQLLEDDGSRILGEAATAVAAVDLARRLRPDVVVLDLIMPELEPGEMEDAAGPTEVVLDLVSSEESGMRAAAQLLADDDPPTIVIVSSLFDPTVEIRARRLGAGYVDKVAGIDALERAIEGELGERIVQ
jgi:DNA-binding NarL/FixJ family response regulator